MYYLSDIDKIGKVGSTLFLPSEKYIGYLGWDKKLKEKEGVFLAELPTQKEGDFSFTELYLDKDKKPYWKYGESEEPFDLNEIAFDHEYRLTYLELGI